MNNKKLQNALNNIDQKIIEDAVTYKKDRPPVVSTLIVTLAVLSVAALPVSLLVTPLFIRSPGSGSDTRAESEYAHISDTEPVTDEITAAETYYYTDTDPGTDPMIIEVTNEPEDSEIITTEYKTAETTAEPKDTETAPNDITEPENTPEIVTETVPEQTEISADTIPEETEISTDIITEETEPVTDTEPETEAVSETDVVTEPLPELTDEGQPARHLIIKADKVKSSPSDTVQVGIRLIDNTAVSSIKLSLTFDNRLTLTGAKYDIFDPEDDTAQIFYPEDLNAQPVTLNWVSSGDEVRGDCTYATLTFKVSDDAQGDLFVNIKAKRDDIYDINLENVPYETVNGYVRVQKA